jgi:YD repeat-containing protein
MVAALLDDDSLRAGTALDRSERYIYDADGLLAATIDAEGYFTRHTYDNAGRKVQTRRYANPVPEAERAGGGQVADLQPVADSVRDKVETFFYDARGLSTTVMVSCSRRSTSKAPAPSTSTTPRVA